MSNKKLPIDPRADRRPWGAAARVGIWVLGVLAACADPTEPLGRRVEWLLTDSGERRGVAIRTTPAAGEQWQLWASPGPSPLARIDALVPSSQGIAVNGGFWNELLYPVGVCAGERGIASARAHRWGIAADAQQIWIGPLAPEVVMQRAAVSQDVELNPRPLPRRSPFLIDARAYPYPAIPPAAGLAARLDDDASSAPLRFNTERRLRVASVEPWPAGVELPALPSGSIWLWLPDRAGDAPTSPALPLRSGDVVTLVLRLPPLRGEVRWAAAAGPLLLERGELSSALGAMPEDQRRRRDARTLAGIDAPGRTLWIALLARGRDGLPGVDLEEAARTMRELGAWTALNLDGGSSTCLWTSDPALQQAALFPSRRPIHHALFLPLEGGSDRVRPDGWTRRPDGADER